MVALLCPYLQPTALPQSEASTHEGEQFFTWDCQFGRKGEGWRAPQECCWQPKVHLAAACRTPALAHAVCNTSKQLAQFGLQVEHSAVLPHGPRFTLQQLPWPHNAGLTTQCHPAEEIPQFSRGVL